MNTKEVQALESYFKTENDHWNGYAFEMICEVLQKGNFENPETPLKLFSKSIDIFTEHFETPLKAIQLFESETDNQKIDTVQKLFVFEWVYKYVRFSVFDNADMDEIKDLLKSQTERLKVEMNKQPEYNKPLVGNMRETLKNFVQKELEQITETFKDLTPVQKFNVLCKLMPYVFPKVESISSKEGEPFSFD
ncbi:hypothetical protein [Aestuariivivens sediminicola]|uniref:hypothetical protein n=1 Tax=Aestuariivivens sediminicola TaxID=2913560 RepID=UPI001F58F212|nr:hypothetical protein [Aestuariivivens sediminicola]